MHVTIAISILTFSNVILADKIEYQVKAAYLYQFTKFTHWPDEEFPDSDTPIRICVLGSNPFGQLLNKLAQKTSQNRLLKIEYLASNKDISHCHVIYISQSEDDKLKQILTRTKNSPVLTVSDMDDFARRGGIIGLVLARSKIRLEINFEASSKAGVKLSSKLLKIATLINESQ